MLFRSTVVIDSAPVLPVTDAVVAARMADAVVLVALADQSTDRQIREAVGLMGVANERVRGFSSGMLRRLARLGLVKVERYRGARLTAAGRREALLLIRRHRVIETYLVERLGFVGDAVHEEAERLEHAASDALIARMADALGHPTLDPHGSRIPAPRRSRR